MANTNAPFGFRETATVNGPVNFRVSNTWKIASTNTGAIYCGDAVVPVTGSATGYIKQATASTVQLIGIFTGCKYFSTSQKKTVWSLYWPGSDATGDVTAFVVDDPNATFLCQAGGTNVGFALVGQNIQLNVGTGSTTTGYSGMYVESANTTNTLPFKIISIPADPTDPDSTLAYNWVVVGFNNQVFKQLLAFS
jgi:hypothetical protein